MASHKSGPPWWLPIALAIVSLTVSGYLGYSRNDKAIAERVVKVETLVDTIGPRLDKIDGKLERVDDIEKKLDQADDKLDKVLAIVTKELQ